MSKRREVIEGTKIKIYFKGIKCRRCVFAALRTVKLGLTKYGNQTKSLKYSEKKKVLFLTNLEPMFERTATDLDSQPTTQQQRRSCALKNARLLLMVAAVSTIKEMRSQYYKIFKTLKSNRTILMF